MYTTEQIEKYPDSFRHGRRQNDMVNWTLAAMIEKLGDDATQLYHEWKKRKSNLTNEQQHDMLDYEDEEKIYVVWDYYKEEDVDTLEDLMIEMVY